MPRILTVENVKVDIRTQLLIVQFSVSTMGLQAKPNPT
jgi:hypothetical protein